jgi:Tol biopolymer transport system component
MRSGILAIALGVALAVQAQAPAKHPITFDDLIKMHRVSGSQISRDGKWVAYAVSTPDMELNRGVSNIWIIPTAGGDAIQVTQGGRDTSPAWSPDGKMLAFLSARDGNSQVFLLSMEGGEAKKLTQLSTGADLFKWAPDGKSIAFTSAVYVGCKDDACNAKRDEEKEKSKVKARIYEHLLYRHWDHWSEGKRSHLFVMPADGGSPARDLTPEADYRRTSVAVPATSIFHRTARRFVTRR